MKDLITLMKLLKLDEKILKDELYNHLLTIGMPVISSENFLYSTGKIPVLLVAHLDTVFDAPPELLCYDKDRNIIFGKNGGIGGDDRCGVYAILEILKKYRPYVLFTCGEELGGIGADDATFELDRPNVKYIIELDRKGNNDCVFYNCGNEQFIEYIESFGFVTDFGTFSDISILGPEWDIAAVNLSCGYYHEHTEKEYIKFDELQNVIHRVKKMLRRAKYAEHYDYQPIYKKRDEFAFNKFDNYYDDELYDDYFSFIDFLKVYQSKNQQPEHEEKQYTKGTYRKGDDLK